MREILPSLRRALMGVATGLLVAGLFFELPRPAFAAINCVADVNTPCPANADPCPYNQCAVIVDGTCFCKDPN